MQQEIIEAYGERLQTRWDCKHGGMSMPPHKARRLLIELQHAIAFSTAAQKSR
jgi:hypothetical protein